MGTSTYSLEIRDACKRFGGIVATDHVNIKAQRGQIFGIIGPNGAGKTTLFNMITGVYRPTEGDIFLEGESIAGKMPYQIAREGIARTFQNIRLFNDLSVYENVHIAYQKNMTYNLVEGVLKTKKYREQERQCAEACETSLRSVGLWEMRDHVASNLPYGMQRRLEIVRALATSPKVLLLDEPAAGMNEEESERLSEIIKNIRDTHRDITILVIDHHMDVIMDVCDAITVINFGKQLATGTPDEIQQNQEVIDAYLGVGD
ncbi:ABC transporter ATP-binding protein [Anaerotruncus sp. AF02-27]|jgi:branched-chain amino acid transport system ATP-binding protein|uniref:ABC transporter ATP-binding protein n=1 Tax=Anaerotruncus TaxID=244127 RepID=UPI000E5508AD|nr:MULTISPECIES: ABC transporter ATP-binding protein [Anaerotruncus]RGX56842.1 ABC transporter ATP-binding protein [Anaerotruncus sp. AF02-27]